LKQNKILQLGIRKVPLIVGLSKGRKQQIRYNAGGSIRSDTGSNKERGCLKIDNLVSFGICLRRLLIIDITIC
jgi:hypothetical protein